jgi:RNA polymerase sigma-70 factor (ECF subfamily)
MTFDELSSQSKADAEAAARVAPVRAWSHVRAELVEAVWHRHYGDVYRYALTLTRSHEDAQEIASDVFERALRSWTAVPQAPLPWLLVVTRRLATDRWRRARRLASILTSSRRREVSEAGAGERRSEFWAWFESLSTVLTSRQVEVLALRYRRDLTDEQVADVMGLTPSGVRSLVARALDALRAHPELL